MSCEIAKGADAARLIISEQFQAEWQTLQDACPWATSFTAIPFTTTWYNVYRDIFDPVVVMERRGGRLSGLLLLGYRRESGALVPAGSRDAEYDVWLSEAECGEAFIENALDVLEHCFPAASLQFQYLAEGAPMLWTTRGRWAERCEVVSVSRALCEVGDGSRFRESLRKKSNKSRYNRLERIGGLEFTRLRTPEEFAAVLDMIADFSDFRHGAVHSSLPFRGEPLRRSLYLALMRVPRLLHVTVLRLSGELLAAHIGFYNRREVLLGIIAHSPFYAQHSPGKLLMLLLGLELAEERVPTFDLTPGTLSGYKERFATHHDRLYVLTVRFDRRAAKRRRVELRLAGAARSVAQFLRLKPSTVRQVVARGFHILRKVLEIQRLPGRFSTTIKRNWWHSREVRVYRFDAATAASIPQLELMMRDDVPSLLLFSPARGTGPGSLQEFLSDSLARLEDGGHVYTRVESGRLAHYGWMERAERVFLNEIGQFLDLPPHSVVLRAYFTHPDFRGRGLYSASLFQMLREGSAQAGVENIYIWVLGDNLPSRKVIEKAGFTYERSLWKRKRFWNQTVWTESETGPPREIS